MVLCLGAAVYILWRKTTVATGITKLQLRYLLLGVFLGGIGIVTTNLIIPLIWKTSRFSVLGPYFTLVFASFSAHAIIRHRLMDIRIVVRRGVVFSAALALTSLLVIASATIISLIAGHESGALPLAMVLAIALVFALVFEPLRNSMNDSFNRYLYREPYDDRRTLREASRRLSTTLHLPTLLSHLAEVLDHTIKPETLTLYLRDPTSDRFRLTFLRNTQPNALDSQLDPALSQLVAYLNRTNVSFFAHDSIGTGRDLAQQPADDDLVKHGAELAFPLRHDQHLTGMLLVGPKRSGDPYFPADIDLLTTLVSQAAIAIKNAQLYSQVVLANQYIQNMLSTMESGVIAVDAAGDVTLFNSAATRMTGLSRPAVGGSLDTLPSGLARPLVDTLADGSPRMNIELTLHDDFSRRALPVICSTSVLRDESGSPVGAVAVFSDLTTIKQLEADKRRVERLASVGALASGIAHEIKNPLVAIRTFAELLPERFSDDEFRTSFSQVAIREIDRIDNLIGRLRGLAPPASPSFSPVDIREPLGQILSLLRARLEQAHIGVKVYCADDLPLIHADHDQLKQLFLNLLVNALEAMGAHGEVTIHVQLREAVAASVLTVEICDTGIGIPDSIAGHVFDPFVTSKPQGSGLGLSICRGIADAHRATIRIENNPNGPGACATLEFVVDPQETKQPRRETQPLS